MNGQTNGKDLVKNKGKMSTDQAQIRGETYPEKTGYRSRDRRVTHGAYRLIRAFYAGTLDKRKPFGKLAANLQARYARHCGYDSFHTAPITVQTKICLAIANQLFLATFLPEPESKTGGRDIRSAENTLNRIMNELGLWPAPKPPVNVFELFQKAEERMKSEPGKPLPRAGELADAEED
jgi:hypothetical protein